MKLSRVPQIDRAGMLETACAGDAALRAEVDALLASLDLPDSVLPASAAGSDHAAQQSGVGGFTIIRQIGNGAAGVVHLARQQHPARIVALKILRREFVASSIQRRFVIEAEVLAQLHHPGIAQIHAAHPGDDDTPPFIAMEFVDGPPLTEYVEVKRLQVRETVEIVARVCDAIQHAHQRGIIHRDLKPGNILVTADGQPKVLDFGVARRVSQRSPETLATESGQLLGTLAFMSPEQVRAIPEEVDTRTDIHALGVILFRLLAGRLPFAGDDPPLPELARRIVEDDAPRLGTIDSTLKGDLEIIVARALSKEKERRYASAASLASDLRRYLAGQPIAATADSAWYVVRRQVARYRVALGFIAAALLAVSGLASYAVVQRSRADQTNVLLQDQLATSTIERGRLLGITGNQPVAEELVWRELFRNPDSRHARWALWEIYAREPNLWTRVVHPTGTQTLRFTPDGRTLVTAGRLDGTLNVLDAATGTTRRTITWVPKSTPRRMHLIAKGSRVLLATDDGSIRVWEVATGRLLSERLRAVPRLSDLAVSEGGETLVAVAAGRVEFPSLDSSRRREGVPLATRPISVALDPRGSVAMVVGQDGHVTAIDVARRSVRWQVRGHSATGLSVAIDPTAERAASGDVTGGIRVWRVRDGAVLREFDTANGRMRSLMFGRDAKTLLVTGVWRTELWQTEDVNAPPRVFGASDGSTDAQMLPEATRLATCDGGTGEVRMWNPAAESRISTWAAHTNAVSHIVAGPDPDTLVTTSLDGGRASWRIGRSDPIAKSVVTGGIAGFDVSSNGRWVVTSGSAQQAIVWRASNGAPLASLSGPRSARTAVFADSDRRVFVGQNDGVVRVWDWDETTGARLARSLPSEGGEAMVLLADGPNFFTAYASRAIVLRQAATTNEIRRFRTTSAPFSMALTPDRRYLAAGTFLGAVDVFEVATGALVASLKGQTALVPGLAFTSDGRSLAVASRDGSTRLWDFEARQLLATVASRRPGAASVKLLADDRRLAVGYDDGVVEVHDLDYYFQYAAGNAAHQLKLFEAQGETFARGGEVLAWADRVLLGR